MDRRNEETFSMREMITKEAKYIIGLIFFVVGAVGPYYSIREDLALIQKDISIINSNHEQHIQDIMQEIKEIKVEQATQQSQMFEVQKQVLISLQNKK